MSGEERCSRPTRLRESSRTDSFPLDVADTEPLSPSSPLWGMENVLLTPHVSGRGFGHDKGTEQLIWEIVTANLTRYLEGKNLRHIVDINRGY